MEDLLKGEKNAPALIIEKEIITYYDLERHIDTLIQKMKASGIREGDRVCFKAPPTFFTILTFMALFKIGASACPVHMSLPEKPLSDYLLDVKANFFIDNDKIIRKSWPQSTRICFFTLLATSASSGRAKIAAHSKDNFLYSASGSINALKLDTTSRCLLTLPLNHVGGIAAMLRSFLCGAAIVLSKEPLGIALCNYSISHVSVVPTHLYRLLHLEETLYLPHIKSILVGGAPLPDILFQRALDLNLPVMPTYGMTEMTSQITMLIPEGKNTHASCGKPLEHRYIKIGEDGEILTKGPTLFQGYLDTKDDILTLPLHEGWFATKDIGFLDSNGHLQVLGRKDSMFISGGENIHPETMEKALCSLPGVIQAAVIAISDPEFGQRPVAFIDSERDLRSVKEDLRHHLPRHYIPKYILPLPPTSGLKPSRSKLQKLLCYFQEINNLIL